MERKPEPDDEQKLGEINAWRRDGLTWEEIGVKLGCSKQWALQLAKRLSARYRKPTERAADHIPLSWDDWMTEEHRRASAYQNLRNHLTYIETSHNDSPETRLSAESLQKLEGFYRRLRETNTVVVFNPAIPPKPGNKFGGWDYEQRKLSDRDYLIRRNHFTKIKESDMRFWKLPDEQDDFSIREARNAPPVVPDH